MDCYNTILIDCPKCKSTAYLDSKAGTCCGREEELSESEIEDIQEWSGKVITCEECGNTFMMKLNYFFEIFNYETK